MLYFKCFCTLEIGKLDFLVFSSFILVYKFYILLFYINYLTYYFIIILCLSYHRVSWLNMYIFVCIFVCMYAFTVIVIAIVVTIIISPWAVTRPILSMLLADEGCFHFVQETLVGEQITESGRRLLTDEFAKLTSEGSSTTSFSIGLGGGLYGVQSTTSSGGIQQSLEIYNRDKFTQRLIAFKSNTRDLFWNY